MSENDRRDPSRCEPMSDPGDRDRTQSDYLDEREEWDAGGVAGETTAPQPVVRSDGRPAPPALPSVVRGIARGVELRSSPEQQERLVFRVDQYDRDGNRLTPVPVELTRFRRGLVTDGDEVEVAGRWSHGTLRATRITNLTTASEVRGWFPRGAKWIALAAALAVAIIAAAIVVVVLTTAHSNAHTVAVPDVAGKDEATAVAAIRSAGLSATRFPEPSADVAKGTVIRTEPDAGVRIDTHAPVIVVVSSGPTPFASSATPPTQPTPAPSPTNAPPIATDPPAVAAMLPVPNVTGQTEQDATNALKKEGFAVAVEHEDSADVPAGSVTRTDPPALASAARGSTVKIFISTPGTTTTTSPLP